MKIKTGDLFKRKKKEKITKDEAEDQVDGLLFTEIELFLSLEMNGLSGEDIQRARENHAETLYKIGKMYLDSQSYFKALDWFRKASFQNYVLAQTMIGKMYKEGLGVYKSTPKAMHWSQLSASTGCDIAQHQLGILYEEERNYEQALRWYQESAKKENKFAEYRIGRVYLHGLGVQQNVQKAIQWFLKSANQNVKYAQYNLGWIYEFKDEVLDLQSAFHWYKKAADQGHNDSKLAVERLEILGYREKNKEKEERRAKPENKKKSIPDDLETKLDKIRQQKIQKEESMKELESNFRYKLNLLEAEKDMKLNKLKETLERTKMDMPIALDDDDGDTNNDFYYDSSDEKFDSNNDRNNDSSDENDINYDSSENEDIK